MMNIDRWADTRLGSGIITSSGSEYRVNCPFCKARVGREDTKLHMYISMVKPVASCKRCDWGGHYVELVMSVEGCQYAEALEHIGNPLPDISRYDTIFSPRGLSHTIEMCAPPGFMPFTGGLTESVEGDVALKYAKSRLKICRSSHPLLINHFGYVPGSNRLWILIDEWFWQGRSLVDSNDVKYISPPWPKGDSLWNAKALEIHDHIIVCEGVFSAHHAGPNALALCGKKATPEQIERIVSKKPQSVKIMLDAGAYLESLYLAADLLLVGYSGRIYLHSLYSGDPADSLVGEVEEYDWSSGVIAALEP